MLSRQWTTKVLIRLCGCGGWFPPLLFTYGINRFFHDVAQMIHKILHSCSCIVELIKLVRKTDMMLGKAANPVFFPNLLYLIKHEHSCYDVRSSITHNSQFFLTSQDLIFFITTARHQYSNVPFFHTHIFWASKHKFPKVLKNLNKTENSGYQSLLFLYHLTISIFQMNLATDILIFHY